MKNHLLKSGAFLIALALICPAIAEAAPNQLMGKWQVVAMERDGKRMPAPKEIKILIEFAPKGKFIATMKAGEREETEKGTYKVKGKTLTTVVKKKTESMTYKVKGKELILTKKIKKRTESMILKKVK